MRESNRIKETTQAMQEQEIAESRQEKRIKEIERRKNPKTPEDFAILHAEVEEWVFKERKRIYELPLTEDDRKAALRQLLKDETKFLQQIDRLKIKAHGDNKEQKAVDNLKKVKKCTTKLTLDFFFQENSFRNECWRRSC